VSVFGAYKRVYFAIIVGVSGTFVAQQLRERCQSRLKEETLTLTFHPLRLLLLKFPGRHQSLPSFRLFFHRNSRRRVLGPTRIRTELKAIGRGACRFPPPPPSRSPTLASDASHQYPLRISNCRARILLRIFFFAFSLFFSLFPLFPPPSPFAFFFRFPIIRAERSGGVGGGRGEAKGD